MDELELVESAGVLLETVLLAVFVSAVFVSAVFVSAVFVLAVPSDVTVVTGLVSLGV
jgi:hypothetical protein